MGNAPFLGNNQLLGVEFPLQLVSLEDGAVGLLKNLRVSLHSIQGVYLWQDLGALEVAAEQFPGFYYIILGCDEWQSYEVDCAHFIDSIYFV